MKTEFLSDALDNINDEIIEKAARLRGGNKRRTRSYWAWAAVFVGIIAAAAVAIAVIGRGGRADRPNNEEMSVSENGVYIPKMKVDLNNSGAAADMMAFFIYGGRVYGEDSSVQASGTMLLGEKLGTATGLIDEWTEKDGYVELAGSVGGDFYSVKGFDPEFMLCLDNDHATFAPYICGTDITLKYGSELYEDRLHIARDIAGFTYETGTSWQHGMGETYRLAADTAEARAFITAMNEGRFTTLAEAARASGKTQAELGPGSALYHVYFELSSGITVRVRLLQGGYVMLDAVRGALLKVSDEAFNSFVSVMDARSGSAVNETTPFELAYAECLNDRTFGEYIPEFVPEDMAPVSAELFRSYQTNETRSISLLYEAPGVRGRSFYLMISPTQKYPGFTHLTPDTLSAEALERCLAHLTNEWDEKEHDLIDAVVLDLEGVSVEFTGYDITPEEAFLILRSVCD